MTLNPATVLARSAAVLISVALVALAAQAAPPSPPPLPTVTIPAATPAADVPPAPAPGSVQDPAASPPPAGGSSPGPARDPIDRPSSGPHPGENAAPAPDASTFPPLPPDDALYAERTRHDRIGRVLAAVTLNGTGPFRLVVDTGATRSALSPRAVERLGLKPDPDYPVRLRGVTGTRIVPTVYIDRLEAGEYVLEHVRLPIVEPGVLADADGILGLAGLGQERLEVDFDADRTKLLRSTKTRAQQIPTGSRLRGGVSQSVRSIGDANVPSLLRVPLTRSRGGLLVAQARVGRVQAKAVIDTGAARTLGNAALRDALARSAKDPQEPNTYVVGATPDVAPGLYLVAPPIKLGDVVVSRVALTYGDFHVFESWQMDDEPALLVGMDVLGRVEELVLDFRTHELLLRQ